MTQTVIIMLIVLITLTGTAGFTPPLCRALLKSSNSLYLHEQHHVKQHDDDDNHDEIRSDEIHSPSPDSPVISAMTHHHLIVDAASAAQRLLHVLL